MPPNYRLPLALLSFLLTTSAFSPANGQDTATVNRYISEAQKRIAENEIDSAETYYRKAGELAKKLNYHEGFLEYTGRYTGLLYSQLRYREALDIAKQQLALSLGTGNKRKAANAYNNIALQYQALGDLRPAAENMIAALELSETLQDPENRQKYYSNLSSLFYDLKDSTKSLFYARKGYALALQLEDDERIARSLVNLTISEVMNGALRQAISHSLEIVRIGQQLQDMDLLLTAHINLGDIYNQLHAPDTALVWQQKALALLEGPAPPDYRAYVYFGLANSYARLQQHRKANMYFDKALADAEAAFPRSELKEFYKLGYELKEAVQQYPAALVFSKKLTALADSLTNADTQAAIQELEIRYQSAQKEKTLAQQQLQISRHETRIQRQNKWMLLFSAVIALMAAAAAIIHLVSRQKKKTQLLEARLHGEEKERTRTARELHDGIGGILSSAKMHLHSGEHERTGSLIEEAIREVRSISHNLAPDTLLQEGLAAAVRNYCARVNHADLPVELYILGEIPELAPDHALLIYRMIQECVNNIIKHSGATQAMVQLTHDQGLLTVTIEDNGSGFDISKQEKKGLGLTNLIARIRLLNGQFHIHSAPGEGTSAYFELPVHGILSGKQA